MRPFLLISSILLGLVFLALSAVMSKTLIDYSDKLIDWGYDMRFTADSVKTLPVSPQLPWLNGWAGVFSPTIAAIIGTLLLVNAWSILRQMNVDANRPSLKTAS